MDTVGAVGFALIFHPGPKKERKFSATGSGFPVTSLHNNNYLNRRNCAIVKMNCTS
jgi:hypothetical protein